MTTTRFLCVALALSSVLHGAELPTERALTTLGKAEKPRFALTDRDWPQQPGGASVCLWRKDALAALSITIDDNSAPDHDWWIEQGARTGWRFTWFVITGQVGQGDYFGTWEGFARLRSLGHDVQSHSVTHLNPDRGFTDIATEYRESAAELERRLPGLRALTLAYPGGKNSHFNDAAVAAKTYIAARGGRGLINPANQIDYLGTASVGGIFIDNPKAPWADVLNLFDAKRYRPDNYRGWYCSHFHGVKAEVRAELAASLDRLKAHGDDVWVGLFREVVQYGQERDTAELTATLEGSDAVRLALRDRMDDARFDAALTVKVRLPGDWTAVEAEQGGRPVATALVAHEGAVFALVEVVPDRGDATVRRRAPTR